MKLKNKTVIITGGSRGIGKAIAHSFLSEGARVALCARSAKELEKTIKEFKASNLNEVIGIPTDISDRNQVEKLVFEVERRFDTIEILINNAGAPIAGGLFADIDIEDWVRSLEVNLLGAIYCTKAVLPRMISRKSGKIINISGGGGVSPNPSFSAYAVSKVGIVRFTETLALELEEHGIQVNAVAPGPTDTEFFREMLNYKEKIGEKKYLLLIDAKEKGLNPPNSSCDLVIHLASDQSNNITGKLISPRWDDWENFNENFSQIQNSSLFTLRRIDNITWFEKKA